jgi:ZIP family zinc transporter
LASRARSPRAGLTATRQGLAFIAAITIHNLPEGLAVGVGFAGGDTASGTVLAIGIGLQNLPEGLAVAIALIAIGRSRMTGVIVGALTGLIEPIGAVLGVTVAVIFEPLLRGRWRSPPAL